MEPTLLELLPHCTARITQSGQNRAGTGCFVAPGILLTCAHVIANALPHGPTSPSPFEVFWNGRHYSAQVLKQAPDYDLALLQVSIPEHPCILLQDEVQLHEHLISYGYPDDYPQGDTVTGEFEGVTSDTSPLLKFKLGLVRPGMSGAPLINERTGAVCGIIKRSRSRESDLGGRAIPIQTILQVFPELVESQHRFQRSDQGWELWLQLHPLPPHANHNHLLMLERVRKKWIKGMLEPSLHAAPLITLGLQERPDLIQDPLREEMQELELPSKLLREGTRLLEVYDETDGGLLLLGTPGSGKTTLLLDLTADLLVRAEHDETKPIPVVLPLASWGINRLPLEQWLVEELFIKYQVPRATTQEWIANEELLPLLDGLDEVAAEHRSACIEAINTYRRTHGFVPLVVTSRSTEYTSQSQHLLLGNAVLVQPLTDKQIENYLARTSDTFAPVRKVLAEDATLRELIATPLMLGVLAVIYADQPLEGLVAAKADAETRRRQIFASYVQHMLHRRGAHSRYTPEQTVRWLVWLAQQMKQHQQTEFYLERIQPDWLSAGHWWQQMYRVGVRLCLVLLFAVCGALAGGVGKALSYIFLRWKCSIYICGPSTLLDFGRVMRGITLPGLGLGLLFGLLIWMKTSIQPAEMITWSWRRLWQRPENVAMLRDGFVGTLIMIPLIVYSEYHTTLYKGENFAMQGDLFFGLIFGLFFGIAVGIAGRVLQGLLNTHTSGATHRNRRAIAMAIVWSFSIAIIVGVLYGLLFWKVQWSRRFIILGSEFLGVLAGTAAGLVSKALRVQAQIAPQQTSKLSFPLLLPVSLLVGLMTGGTMQVFLWWIAPWWPKPFDRPGWPFVLVWLTSILLCGLAFALLYHTLYIRRHQPFWHIGLAFGLFNGCVCLLSYWLLCHWLAPQIAGITLADFEH